MTNDEFMQQVTVVDLLDVNSSEDVTDTIDDPMDEYLQEYMYELTYRAMERMIDMDSVDHGYTERMLEREVQTND